jgi:CDR ABC transporter
MQDDMIPVTYNEAGEDTISNFIDETYGYEHGFRWGAVGINCAIVILLRFIVALATKYLHFQKR